MSRRIASNRRSESGGQALVMVSLALFAMTGMMGLGVDMGWSFFVQKQAQAAADGAALGAVQEAMARLGNAGASGFSCASQGTGATQVQCQTSSIVCSSVVSTSNLNNGCKYAVKNGFDSTVARTNVRIQSNDGQVGNLPPTAPGVLNLSYWVTVRTVRTIPQLFSAINGNAQGTVAAVATAAIAASIGPGSFYGMNRIGDCTNSPDGAHCGTDIITGTGKGNTNCPAPYAGTSGSVCAPMGIILSSACNTKQNSVCDDGFASEGGGAGIAASNIKIMTGGILEAGGDYHDMNGKAITATPTSNPNTFKDFYDGLPQPPLQASNALGAIGACGYPNGNIPANVTLGPYQYYSFKVVGGVNIPDAKPITVGNGVTFSPTQTGCSGAGAVYTPGAAQSTNFPSYIFWGGMTTADTATFGAGQYVMAGTRDSSNTGTVFSVGGTVNGNGGSSITGDSSTGTAFIFTDGNYPGLAAQKSLIPSGSLLDNVTQGTTLYQGTLAFKNSDVNLTGMVGSKNVGSNLPSALDAYSGIAWWQDRRNSYADGYNEPSGSAGCVSGFCTGDDGVVKYCATGGDCPHPNTADLTALKTANHVTPTSAGVTLEPGNVNMNMAGAFYQPRGAWMYIKHGTGTLGGPLQVITGALIEDTGDTRLLLQGPTTPIVRFKATLIQ